MKGKWVFWSGIVPLLPGDSAPAASRRRRRRRRRRRSSSSSADRDATTAAAGKKRIWSEFGSKKWGYNCWKNWNPLLRLLSEQTRRGKKRDLRHFLWDRFASFFLFFSNCVIRGKCAIPPPEVFGILIVFLFRIFAWPARWTVKWNRASLSESVFISAFPKEEIQGNESLYVSKRKGGGGEKAKIAGQETKNANFAKKQKYGPAMQIWEELPIDLLPA